MELGGPEPKEFLPHVHKCQKARFCTFDVAWFCPWTGSEHFLDCWRTNLREFIEEKGTLLMSNLRQYYSGISNKKMENKGQQEDSLLKKYLRIFLVVSAYW